MLDNKKLLITGVITKDSIAWRPRMVPRKPARRSC